MGLLARHLLWDLFRVLVVTTTAITLMAILGGLAQEAVKQGLGPGTLVVILPYLIPSALVFALPGAVLFSVCHLYGRMEAESEITALKAGGVSPWSILWPGYVFAFILSIFAVWVNDVSYSWGQAGLQQVVVQSIEEIAYGMLQTNRSYATKRFTISVKEVAGRKLLHPTIVFHRAKDFPAVTLVAQEAELKFNAEDNTLSIFLTRGIIEADGVASMEFDDTIERVVPLGEDQPDDAAAAATVLAMSQMPQAMELAREKIDLLTQTLAANAAYDLALGDITAVTGPQRSQEYDEVQRSSQKLNRLITEPWRRWANGFSCLAFVVIGAPVSIWVASWLRRSDVLFTFLMCLPILIFYYLFLAFGIDRAKTGLYPPAIVWLGNAACLAVGALFTWRVQR